MEEAPFIVTIVAITMGTFLVTMRMIIGHLRWRVQHRQRDTDSLEGSMRMAELEEMVRQAALEANEPLARRMESLDRQMRALAAPPTPVQPPDIEVEAPAKRLGRLSSGS